jgi:hypothetical protein
MSDAPPHEPDLLHGFRNYLAVVVGFSDLLLTEFSEDDPRRGDVLEIYNAGRAAMAMIPELSERLR